MWKDRLIEACKRKKGTNEERNELGPSAEPSMSWVRLSTRRTRAVYYRGEISLTFPLTIQGHHWMTINMDQLPPATSWFQQTNPSHLLTVIPLSRKTWSKGKRECKGHKGWETIIDCRFCDQHCAARTRLWETKGRPKLFTCSPKKPKLKTVTLL